MGKRKRFTEEVAPVPQEPVARVEDVVDAICPTCGPDGDVVGGKCRKCGARKTVNQVSRNEIWMRNGRLVKAFRDSRQAYVQMAERYGIPKERWPEEFRNSATPAHRKDR
jgi:hypothetical protein